MTMVLLHFIALFLLFELNSEAVCFCQFFANPSFVVGVSSPCVTTAGSSTCAECAAGTFTHAPGKMVLKNEIIE